MSAKPSILASPHSQSSWASVSAKENPQLSSCGSWRLEREIGHGAYGVVYLAFSPDGEHAAVKVCRRDAVDLERYSRELRGAKLYRAIPPQEGLVRMRTLAETEWGFYAVMDLADDEFGGASEFAENYRPKTLASVIKGEKALPMKDCVNLAVSLARGLAALQRHHLLHRDIKPANVLYVCGRPVLSDPGLLVEESEAVSLVGTPGYVPPENFTDAASDVYSLGLTLKAASFGRQIEDVDKGPAVEADTGAPLFPSWWRILNKATDPVPSRRYQSAKALLRDLNALSRRTALAKWSWLRWASIGVLLAAAAAYMHRSYRERKRLETELEPLRRVADAMKMLNDVSSKDDAVWSSFPGSYFCHTDETHRQRLKRAEAKDPVRAAEMRALLDKMVEIDGKGEENNRRIQVLHEEAKAGKDASEKYNQAELLSMENEKLVKSWLSLLEQFTVLEDEVKGK